MKPTPRQKHQELMQVRDRAPVRSHARIKRQAALESFTLACLKREVRTDRKLRRES